MHIKRVELEDIKSHAHSTYEFSRGSTAITGENGAGKTTILEAIAWTMFDVLDYKKDDFVRRGAKKGSARVSFESGLDEREYLVYRDTGTGYYVYDPELKVRIADKKEEVRRFLWQHLGVEPGTDLETLFKQAIGVPQGTFTAIFLATAADRKRTFDALLKVEEYRRSAEELLKTQRHIENRIAGVREKIARAEGELSRYELYEAEMRSAASDEARLSGELQQAETAVKEKERLVGELDRKEQEIANARGELEAARGELSRLEVELRHRSAELEHAKDAALKIDGVRVDAARHTEVLARLAELERERTERDRLRSELVKIESAEAAVKAEEKHVRAEITAVEEAHRELKSIAPRVAEQAELEKQAGDLRNRIAQLNATAERASALDAQLETLRASYAKNKKELDEAIEKAESAKRVAELQTRETELVNELARLRASLERDEKFRSEIQNGFCPILSAKCLNLAEGQTLESFIATQFEDHRTRITVLEVEHVTVRTELSASREAEKIAARLATLEERSREIADEGKRLRAERDQIEKAAGDAAAASGELIKVEAQISELGDPRSQASVLESRIAREMDLREKVSAIEKNLERLGADRQIAKEQLDDFNELDAGLAEAAATRDATAEAHRTFLSFESAAKALPERESAFSAAQASFTAADVRRTELEKAFNTVSAGYDRDVHMAERAALDRARQMLAETRVRLETARERLAALKAEIERLGEIRKSLDGEIREKDRLDRVLETTAFIRETLKEAAPLVARNYVYHVSAEANLMFREISGNAERTLKWSEDYGIFLEEGGYDRPFQSLSGGEQMAAALSVRLALLKQLSDIRIAFFDEPTTNMDAGRRENLAMQIGQIRHFDQLFVISHDDTFEGYMDHEVRIERA